MRNSHFILTIVVACWSMPGCTDADEAATESDGVSPNDGATADDNVSDPGEDTLPSEEASAWPDAAAGGNSTSDELGTDDGQGGAGGMASAPPQTGTGGGASQPSADAATSDDLYAPADIVVSNVNGEGKAVNVVAFTLLNDGDGSRIYAALRNDGDVWACDGAVSFELFDGGGVSVGAWIGGLYSSDLFRRSDDMGGLVACFGPGDTALAALTDLPRGLAIDEVSDVLYQLTYFDRDILPFDLIPVDGLAVSDVQSVSTGSGSAFTGTLENALDVPIDDASVTIFALNDVGRPLAVATSEAAEPIAPGGSWTFETGAVPDPGVELVAYPSGSVEF